MLTGKKIDRYPYIVPTAEGLVRLVKNLTTIIAISTKIYIDRKYTEKNEEIEDKLNKIKKILELVETL